MVHIFEIPDPNLLIHFVTFRALRRRLSHVIGENSVYPIFKAKKFTAHASRDLYIGGLPKPHVTIFCPRICLFIYNFYEATMTIKGSLCWSIPMLTQFSGAKKTKSGQNWFPKWRFFGNIRV